MIPPTLGLTINTKYTHLQTLVRQDREKKKKKKKKKNDAGVRFVVPALLLFLSLQVLVTILP